MKLALRLALLVAIFPLFLGCEDEEVAWLPDSSGVVLRDQEQGYSVYDVKTKTLRSILPAQDAETQAIAINTKGDQLAVAQVDKEEGQGKLQVILYTLAGKEAHRSPAIALPKPLDTAHIPTEVGLEWSTGGNLVVYLEGAIAGFYDPRTTNFRAIQGYGRFLEERWIGVNLLPDGSGVLALRITDGVIPEGGYTEATKPTHLPDPAVIDWEGRVRMIKMPKTPAELNKLLWNEEHTTCGAEYANWHGNVLRHQMLDFCLDIDVKKYTATWYRNPLNLAARIPGRDPNLEYTALPVGKNGLYVYVKSSETELTLETINTKTGQHRVLAKDVEIEGALRSPDGSKVAITLVEGLPGGERAQRKLLIVDDTGTIIADLKHGEFDTPPAPPAPEFVPPGADGEAPPAPAI